jgi:hypothetical protein
MQAGPLTSITDRFHPIVMRHHVGRRIAEAARLGTAPEGLTAADLVHGV